MSICLQNKDFLKEGMELHTFFCFQNRSRDLHSHEFWELVFVYDGEGTHDTESSSLPLSAGDVIIVKPGTAHCLVSAPEKELYVCNCLLSDRLFRQLLAELSPVTAEYDFTLYPLLTDSQQFFHIFRPNDSNCIRNMFWTITHEYNHYSLISMDIITLTLRSLLLSLMRNYEYASKKISNPVTNNSDIDDIITYLQINYRSPITLSMLSNHFHLSREYLCRYFKRVTGQTINQFLMEIRITHAKGLLLTTQYPISDIGAVCGIPTPGNFYKVFKKQTGLSPQAFRAQRNHG